MKVCLITDRYPPEARSAAHLFEDLARGLAGRGHAVTVLTKMPVDYVPPAGADAGSVLPRDRDEGGVRVLRVPGLFGFGGAIALKAADQAFLTLRIFWRLLRLERPDAIVVYTPPLPLAAAGAVYRSLTGVRHVLNLHDLYPRTAVELGALKSRVLIRAARVLEDAAYRGTDSFVVPSPGSRSYLVDEKGVAAGRVSLVYNWVDCAALKPGGGGEFRKKHGLEGRFLVSYAGLMGYAQDLSSAVEAARLLAEEKELAFRLVGDGVHRSKWERLCRELPNAEVLPALERDEYFELLHASDVCLVPLDSRLSSPAIPGKLQNIMALGKPALAVVPPGSEAAKIVQRSRCGLLVPPGDAGALAGAIRKLRGDASLREELGAAGRAFAERHFSIETALDLFEASLRPSRA